MSNFPGFDVLMEMVKEAKTTQVWNNATHQYDVYDIPDDGGAATQISNEPTKPKGGSITALVKGLGTSTTVSSEPRNPRSGVNLFNAVKDRISQYEISRPNFTKTRSQLDDSAASDAADVREQKEYETPLVLPKIMAPRPAADAVKQYVTKEELDTKKKEYDKSIGVDAVAGETPKMPTKPSASRSGGSGGPSRPAAPQRYQGTTSMSAAQRNEFNAGQKAEADAAGVAYTKPKSQMTLNQATGGAKATKNDEAHNAIVDSMYRSTGGDTKSKVGDKTNIFDRKLPGNPYLHQNVSDADVDANMMGKGQKAPNAKASPAPTSNLKDIKTQAPQYTPQQAKQDKAEAGSLERSFMKDYKAGPTPPKVEVNKIKAPNTKPNSQGYIPPRI